MTQRLITDYFSTIVLKNKKNEIESNIIFYPNDNSIANNKKSKQIIYGYNPNTDSWNCTVCGDDIGSHNPRQLCGKTFCRNQLN